MVHNADADDHDGENRRRQRRTEEGGEEGRHSAEGRRPQIPVIHLEHPAHIPADGTSHLQCRALPSGGTAAKVGEHGSNKNRRQQQNRQRLSQMHGVDDVVGTQALGFGDLIKSHDQKSCHRQAEQQPGLRGTQQLRLVDANVEHGPHKTAAAACHRRQYQPFYHGLSIELGVAHPLANLLPVHFHFYLFPRLTFEPGRSLPARPAGSPAPPDF